MRQYLDAKEQYRDAILLFRMGDFYEMFYEDALVASRALEITLTSRSKDANGGGIPMCGVPYHAVDTLHRAPGEKGFRVAICDQVEDPRKAKGLVKREVVRVVSPGTLTDASYPGCARAGVPDGDRAASTARRRPAIATASASRCSICPPGEFSAAEYAGPDGLQALADEIAVLKPREIVVPARRWRHRCADRAVVADGIPITPVDAWTFERGIGAPHAARRSCAPAASKGSASTGIRPRSRRPARSSTICASTQKVDLAHVRAIAYRPRADALLIDPTTLEASGDRRGVGRGPRRARCSTKSIAR